MAKELEIEITRTGMKVDAKGFTGNECNMIVDEIEAAMVEAGVEVQKKDRKVKAEAGLPATGQAASARRV